MEWWATAIHHRETTRAQVILQSQGRIVKFRSRVFQIHGLEDSWYDTIAPARDLNNILSSTTVLFCMHSLLK